MASCGYLNPKWRHVNFQDSDGSSVNVTVGVLSFLVKRLVLGFKEREVTVHAAIIPKCSLSHQTLFIISSHFHTFSQLLCNIFHRSAKSLSVAAHWSCFTYLVIHIRGSRLSLPKWHRSYPGGSTCQMKKQIWAATDAHKLWKILKNLSERVTEEKKLGSLTVQAS